jgi:broad specificity phosphatase PhoE
MAIVIVRHGETPLNAARVLQPPDTPLSERGAAQAQALAARIAQRRVVALLSSDLPRAAQTARAISTAIGLTPDHDALLQERNFGALRGRAYDSLDFDPLALQEAPPGGESVPQFEARVACALDLLRERAAGLTGDLVVVSHGLLIRTLLARYLKMPDGVAAPEHLLNTSVTIFDAAPPHRVSLANCAVHLEGAAVDDGRGVSGI